MSVPHLDLATARHLQLAAQGLLKAPRRRATRADVLAAIRQMALLQIDTIHVVARSPYLVLYSRLGPYPQAWLDDLLREGALFEYWAHEACFVPSEDYGLLRHRMLDPAGMGWKFPQRWLAEHADAVDALEARIRQHGPVRSADFVREGGKGNGWWDWKPEKRHLEALFTLGRVMVKERRNFQRVYDVREHIRPDWDDERDLPTPDEVRTRMLMNTCKALGIVRPAWVADYYRLPRRTPMDALYRFADEGRLQPVRVDGLQGDVFVHADLAGLLDSPLRATACTVLSPFDPLVWDRQRARELFGFDYRIECYTPADKRVYGYFVLPILHRGRLIGRLDAKAHRQQGLLEVKSLHLEKGVRCGAGMQTDLGRMLDGLAAWHGLDRWRIAQAPDGLGLLTGQTR